MKKNLFLSIILVSCFLLNGCLDFILTVNRTIIPDSVEGVWKIDGETYEVQKKDDYWANIKALRKGKKDEPLGMTFHKIDGLLLACFTGWNRGEQVGFVLPVEIVNDKKVHLYDFKMNEEDRAQLTFLFTKPKEEKFLSLVKEGKVSVDTSGKTLVLNKIDLLND